MEAFLIELGRQIPVEGPEQKVAAHVARRRLRFEDLRVEMMDHVEREWTVAAMAREVFLSPCHFEKVYRDFFGVSPVEDLLRARIRRACWLLTNTELSMGEVAEQCGFNSPHYFSRVFRKRMGCPPSEYYQRLTGR